MLPKWFYFLKCFFLIENFVSEGSRFLSPGVDIACRWCIAQNSADSTMQSCVRTSATVRKWFSIWKSCYTVAWTCQHGKRAGRRMPWQNVPDHYVPDCLKRPLITTSLLNSLIWSQSPLYVMSLVWNVPGCLQFLYVMSLDHNVPWSQNPLITMSPGHYDPKFCTKRPLNKMIRFLGNKIYPCEFGEFCPNLT
jgi:hypothetical protein